MSNLSSLIHQLELSLKGPLSQDVIDTLFIDCRLDLIQLFFKRGKIPEDQIAILAVKHSHVGALEWAFKKAFPTDPSDLIKALPEKEDVDVLEFLCKSHLYGETDLELIIAQDKPLFVARVLQKQQRAWSDKLTVQALKAGAFNVLKSVYTIDQFKSFPMPDVPISLKSYLPQEEDDLVYFPKKMPDVIQEWVKVNGEPTSINAFEVAAKGRLDVLQWFFPGAKGCGVKT